MIFAFYDKADEDVCKTPQVLEIGKSGKIVCSFSEDFSSIHWYFNLDVKDGLPTISYSSNGVDGTGYTSGEFNIDPDGSLVINNVSVEHEAKFSVVEFETLQDLPREYEINIITFSKYTFFLLWGYPNNIFNNGICVDMLIIGHHSVFESLVEIKLHTVYIVFLDDKF